MFYGNLSISSLSESATNNVLIEKLFGFIDLSTWKENIKIILFYILLFLINFVMVTYYFISIYRNVSHKHIKLTFKLFKDNIVKLFLPVAFLIFIILLVYGFFTTDETFNIFAKSLCFVMLYVVFLSSNVILRCFLLIFSYIIVGYSLAYNIRNLHPLVGKILESPLPQDQSLIAPSFVYTILMILVLFSLQKTARKNSIIPH